MNIDAPKPTEPQGEDVIEPIDPQFDPVLGHFGGNRLQNVLELDVPRTSAFVSQQYDGSQGAVAGTPSSLLFPLSHLSPDNSQFAEIWRQ